MDTQAKLTTNEWQELYAVKNVNSNHQIPRVGLKVHGHQN